MIANLMWEPSHCGILYREHASCYFLLNYYYFFWNVYFSTLACKAPLSIRKAVVFYTVGELEECAQKSAVQSTTVL